MDIKEFTGMVTFYASQMKFAPDLTKPGAIDLWYGCLSKYSPERLKKAFLEAFKRGGPFPDVGELIKILDGPTLSRDHMATKMALNIENQLGKRYELIEKNTSTLEREMVRKFGGWDKLCVDKDEKGPYFNKYIKDMIIAELASEGLDETGRFDLIEGPKNDTRLEIEKMLKIMSGKYEEPKEETKQIAEAPREEPKMSDKLEDEPKKKLSLIDAFNSIDDCDLKIRPLEEDDDRLH